MSTPKAPYLSKGQILSQFVPISNLSSLLLHPLTADRPPLSARWMDAHVRSAKACEEIARAVVKRIAPDRLMAIMSTRFRYSEGGDDSSASSALESAIDQHWSALLVHPIDR